MSKTTFEDVIRDKGVLVYTNVGDSMYPLIKKGDLLVIRAISKPLKKYDIPLYKRDSGQYVLHRIVRVRKDDYLICGDNRYWIESGITDRHIIGELTEIVRSGKTIPVHDKPYAFYQHTLFIRRKLKRILSYIKRIISSLGERT